MKIQLITGIVPYKYQQHPVRLLFRL